LTNIGISPTLKNSGIIEIEAHILDFSGDLYGETLEIELLRYFREEKMFKKVDELKDAIQKDIAMARTIISELDK
jgi:riboflavin kinase/FMN adenylyltransferase